jgi:hypothetical protein
MRYNSELRIQFSENTIIVTDDPNAFLSRVRDCPRERCHSHKLVHRRYRARRSGAFRDQTFVRVDECRRGRRNRFDSIFAHFVEIA